MNVSLRRQLSVWLTVCITAAGAGAATLSFVLSYRDAQEDQDMQLSQVASAFARRAVPKESAPYRASDDEDAESHLVVRPLGTGTRVVDAHSDVALPGGLPIGLQTLRQGDVGWRVAVDVDPTGLRFGVAQRTDLRDEAALQNATLTLVPFLLLIPGLLLLVRWVLTRTFEPLAALSTQVDQLDASKVVQLPVESAPLETVALVRAVNGLVQRLATALEQQRGLVSAAAHELRTPLAALTVQADNVQASGLPPQACARMSTLQDGLARLSAMLEQLLGYARVQGQSRLQSRQEIDLVETVRDVVQLLLPLAMAKQMDLGCLRLDPVSVTGDPSDVHAILRNAIDNAVRYTPPGGRVDVSIVHDDARGRVRIVVVDDGPGIRESERSRVLQPFVRLLGTQEIGSGLGLAIALAAAKALGGTIVLGDRLDGKHGLRFEYSQALMC